MFDIKNYFLDKNSKFNACPTKKNFEMFFYASDTISKTKVHIFHGHFISWSLASTKQLKNN